MITLLAAQKCAFCQNLIKYPLSFAFQAKTTQIGPHNAEHILGTAIISAAGKGIQDRNLLLNLQRTAVEIQEVLYYLLFHTHELPDLFGSISVQQVTPESFLLTIW